jgi:hypothetical protein
MNIDYNLEFIYLSAKVSCLPVDSGFLTHEPILNHLASTGIHTLK